MGKLKSRGVGCQSVQEGGGEHWSRLTWGRKKVKKGKLN